MKSPDVQIRIQVTSSNCESSQLISIFLVIRVIVNIGLNWFLQILGLKVISVVNCPLTKTWSNWTPNVIHCWILLNKRLPGHPNMPILMMFLAEIFKVKKLAKLIVLPSALICTDKHQWQWWTMKAMKAIIALKI